MLLNDLIIVLIFTYGEKVKYTKFSYNIALMFIEQIFGTPRPSYKDLKDFLDSNMEDARVEFKRSVSEDIDKNLLGEVVAFANSQGGILIIGVTDSERQIVGCQETSDSIENHIIDKIEPSMAGLFVIETVETPQNNHVLIVEIENSPEIHAVKLKRNNKKEPFEGYAYYYRNAMSSRLMAPSVLNRISAIKQDLKYNYNFRISIFLGVNEILSEVLAKINFGGKNNIDIEKLTSLTRDYLMHFKDREMSLNSEMVKIIRTIRLEFLYQDIWEEIGIFYVTMLEIERDIPYTVLTLEEEMNLRELKHILNVGLGINRNDANIDFVDRLIHINLNNKVFYNYNIQLLSARGLFAHMLDYLSPQGYEHDEARAKLISFDQFLKGRKNFYFQPFEKEEEWLTIDDLKKLMGEFLEIEPEHENYGVFKKAELRKNDYLYHSTETLASMILKLVELRDYLYENLSLPLSRNALERDYVVYLSTSKTSFVYPAYKGRFSIWPPMGL